MEWLKNIFGGAQKITESGAYGTAENIGFWGQFAVNGMGKYESAMNATKAAAAGDWQGAISGIGGFFAKKMVDDNNPEGGIWNTIKSSIIGEVVEWGLKSLGATGIIILLAVGMLFAPVREFFGKMLGGLLGKKDGVSQEPAPDMKQVNQPAANVSQDKNLSEALRKNAAELERIGLKVNAQGSVTDVSGQTIAPAAALQQLQQAQEKQVNQRA